MKDGSHHLLLSTPLLQHVVIRLSYAKHFFFSERSIAACMQVRRLKFCAIIQNISYPHFMSELRKDIENNQHRLLLDEFIDISNTKYLGITVTYNDEAKEKIISTFLSLPELKEASAESIVTTLKKIK